MRQTGSHDADWDNAGNAICEAVGDQQKVVIATDGSGGAIAAWQDGRSDTTRVYTSRFGADAQIVTAVPPTTPPTTLLPVQFRLLPPHPNPMRSAATITFLLPAAASVDAAIFDVSGRLIRRMTSGLRFTPGEHALRWDGRDNKGHTAVSGVYFVRIQADRSLLVKRLVLLK